MKYIRFKNGIIKQDSEIFTAREIPLKVAETIEELCDEFVVEYGDKTHSIMVSLKSARLEEYNQWLINNGGNIYGAIWTDKGLIYVAKLNEKGDLELL